MEPRRIRGTTNASSHAQGLEGKEISSPSSRGRKMSLTSPLIDQDFSTTAIRSNTANAVLSVVPVASSLFLVRLHIPSAVAIWRRFLCAT